ncbi:MAG: glucose-1-phosphate adenylyltransferase subunit GlgD [Cetobacterium sp.]|uniref:glucose-1-phosphate adenylyltransferase subunit GlgD n=1 Tax=Cetobacterium sp. TaxID=2071632 RepID=UPI002FCA98CD
MLNRYMACIYLEDIHIGGLTKIRNASSVPVGGRYRIMDFALSNLVNAGVHNIGIFLEEENGHSLIDHIGSGEPWDLDRKSDGIFFFNPAIVDGKMANIKVLEKNLEYFVKSKQENIIIINPNIVYNIDLKKIVEEHEKNQNEITVVYKSVKEKVDSCFNKTTNLILENQNIVESGINFFENDGDKISLDMFIMSKSNFLKLIFKRITEGKVTGIKDAIFENIKNYKTRGIEFKGYAKYINSLECYFEFNMDLLTPKIRKELFSGERKIYTKIKDTPPTHYGSESKVNNSLIANGCLIEGEVKDSVIGRRVEIDKGAVVENCIILQGCKIGKDVKLKNVIIDKGNELPEKTQLCGLRKYPLVIEKNLRWYDSELKKILGELKES